jgi:AraC-like DNA-binding protein
MDSVELAVERSIVAMRERLGEAVTIDDLARAAMFSKFHFSRLFQRTTGISPGRFLSALRLQEAKQLLVSTDLNVAAISVQVGYNSVGTFSTRFTRSVGVSPTCYRRLGGFVSAIPGGPGDQQDTGTATVRGTIWPPASHRPGFVFVGLFPDRIPEGRPVRCSVLSRPGAFHLDRVPEGRYYLLSHYVGATSVHAAAMQQPNAERDLAVCSYGPFTLRRGGTLAMPDLRLEPVGPLDPPVLIALLDARILASELMPDLAA